jgi:inosose dehydratase
MLTRRAAIAATTAIATASARPASGSSRLSLQGYIWINLANRAKRPLPGMLDELFPSARAGGFQNIELNDGYFATPELRTKTLELLDKHRLRMPSVYVGGAMHLVDLAEQTIAKALATAEVCRPFGCTAIVHNPGALRGNAQKSDAELSIQSASIARMAEALKKAGMDLRIHHHGVELENNAREFRHILQHTDPKLVTACVDVEFVYRAGFRPAAFVEELGTRVTELHLRNRIGNTPLQAFEPGDVDYPGVAAAIRKRKTRPLIVVELAYHDDTVVSRPFDENVKRSREYAEKLFGRL